MKSRPDTRNSAQDLIKWLAMITMVIDHTRYLFPAAEWLFIPGRFAFPFFALAMAMNIARAPVDSVITEGNSRYLLWLMVFTLLSEVPYRWLSWSSGTASIMPTLMLGLLVALGYPLPLVSIADSGVGCCLAGSGAQYAPDVWRLWGAIAGCVSSRHEAKASLGHSSRFGLCSCQPGQRLDDSGRLRDVCAGYINRCIHSSTAWRGAGSATVCLSCMACRTLGILVLPWPSGSDQTSQAVAVALSNLRLTPTSTCVFLTYI